MSKATEITAARPVLPPVLYFLVDVDGSVQPAIMKTATSRPPARLPFPDSAEVEPPLVIAGFAVRWLGALPQSPGRKSR